MNNPASSPLKPLFDLYRAGEYQTLLEQARVALETRPDEPALHSLAGAAALELHEYEQAIHSYRAALALRPELAKVHNSLGIAYLRTGQTEEAAGSFHNAVKHDSQLAQAWFNLGLVYENRGRLPEAAGYYKQATLLNPVYHQALCSLAKVLWELRIPDQVEDCFEKALAIKADYQGLLRFLEQSNRHEKLREALAQARRVLGEHDIVRLYEGILADIDGEHEQARSQLEAFSIAPIDTLSQHTERTRLARLALICDRLNDTPATIRYAGKANHLSREISDSKGIDKSEFLQTVEKRRHYFTDENISRWPDITSQFKGQSKISGETPTPTQELRSSFLPPRSSFLPPRSSFLPLRSSFLRMQESSKQSVASGDTIIDRMQDKEPVFIIGFPRSGTTLLDTLLRGHPAIRVAEEADAVAAMVNQLSGQEDERLVSLAELSEQDIDALRQTYFNALARHAKPDESITRIDRFALNSVYSGEIYRVFPHARFILLLRHPADCVLSCFLQTFYETSANASFFNLQDSAHLYHQVFSLWRQYTDLLPLNVLQVKYEDLITDVESGCRKILDFLNLPWHEDLPAHQRTAQNRPLIGTASYNQVTRPLYTEAQGRWQRYHTELEPALPVLEPWISYFGY